ncbi:MAG: transposase [Deltaproteobacteria bacterium]|nr:transposase [Deltaproteobacteria bacterium]MBW2352518.1 transposase [Deltaproteobacteria bacterium]
MARALRIQYPGAFYHVTCRGNERKEIFLSKGDQEVFFEKLALSSDTYNVPILAYVLMANHFHLLLTTPDGNLSEFMRHFNISYTAFFNKWHNRVGHLYQGRYKAFLVDADDYLLEVSRYIHLNPVRVKALRGKDAMEKMSILMSYEASSLPGFFFKKKRQDFVHYGFVLDYMGGDNSQGRKRYRAFVNRGLMQDIDNPLTLGKGSGIVGGEDFVQWVKEKFVGEKKDHREQPALRELKKAFSPEELLEIYFRLSGERESDILTKGKNAAGRAMLMELLYRFSRITQSQIGEMVGGVDYSAVSQARSRLRKRLGEDKKLRAKFETFSREIAHLSRIKI